MRLQRVWLIYRADSPLALKEARRCADELEWLESLRRVPVRAVLYWGGHALGEEESRPEV